MRGKFLIGVGLVVIFSLGFKWDLFLMKRDIPLPLKIQTEWVVDSLSGELRRRTERASPPLIIQDMLFQGHARGMNAYNKESGRKLWSFLIPSGTSSPALWHRGNIYFGSADGFFYSLQAESGQLNWKFWTGSENSGPPLIHEDRLYWTANNQKMYALTLAGERVWIYSGPSLPRGFFVRGRPRPAIYKNWIYMGFYNGSLVALDKNTGKVQWKRSLSSTQPIRENLKWENNCLFVPVFDFHLFCLNPLNGKVRWKAKGGFSSYLPAGPLVYQTDRKALYALKKTDGQALWQKEVSHQLSILLFKKYLVYGAVSEGELIVLSAHSGKTLLKHKFGRGLSALSTDSAQSIYFLSVDGYLHKLSIRL